MEYEIVIVKEDCIMAKPTKNNEEMDFGDLSVVSRSYGDTLE